MAERRSAGHADTVRAMADCVLYERTGHVATITYNRPEVLNAVNGEMRRDLNAAFARFRDEEEAWVAIVTGAGRAFCAGADLRDGAGATGEFAGTFWEKPTVNSFESGWEIYKPVIAAVNGHCLGYGLTLVTWCDFVLASDRARFGYPEAALGIPAMVGAIRLPQRIGWADAMELLMTGEPVDADQGARDGPRLAGGPSRRLDDRGGGPGRPTGEGRAAGAEGDEGDGHARPAPLLTRGDPDGRSHAPGGVGDGRCDRRTAGRHRATATTVAGALAEAWYLVARVLSVRGVCQEVAGSARAHSVAAAAVAGWTRQRTSWSSTE